MRCILFILYRDGRIIYAPRHIYSPLNDFYGVNTGWILNFYLYLDKFKIDIEFFGDDALYIMQV